MLFTSRCLWFHFFIQIFSLSTPSFFLLGTGWGSEGRGITHSEQGGCSLFVNGRAPLFSSPFFSGPRGLDGSSWQNRPGSGLDSRRYFSSAGGSGELFPASSTEKPARSGAQRSVQAARTWETPIKDWGWAPDFFLLTAFQAAANLFIKFSKIPESEGR